MTDWFVARSGQQQGPFSYESLRAMATRGELSADDAVWRQGMGQWERAGEMSETSPLFVPAVVTPISYAPAAYNDRTLPVLTPRALEMLRQTSRWVRLFGVLIFIGAGLGGVAAIFTLIAAVGGLANGTNGSVAAGLVLLVFAVLNVSVVLLYLMPGLYLNRYASRINELAATRREDTLEQALEAQKSFWKFVGMLVLISIILWLLMVVLLFVFGLIGMAGASSTPFVPTSPTPSYPLPQTP